MTLSLTFFQENLFAVGARTHRAAELLQFQNWQWKITEPYPHVKDISSMKIISYNHTFFVIGGSANSQVTSDILSFKNETWSRAGSLTSKRYKFSVILNVDKVYVIGGQTKHQNEVCNVTLSSTVNCEQDLNIDFGGSEEPVLIGFSIDDTCDLTFQNYKSKETKELMILSNAKFKKMDHFVPVQKTNYRNDNYIFK